MLTRVFRLRIYFVDPDGDSGPNLSEFLHPHPDTDGGEKNKKGTEGRGHLGRHYTVDEGESSQPTPLLLGVNLHPSS